MGVGARLGRVLLYGSGLVAGGSGLYSLHKSGYDPDNIGMVRFGRAAVAVGRIGLDYRSTLSREYPGEAEYEAAKAECHTRAADRLLDLCLANGGVFIKVGQHIGALDYLLPDEYVSTMKILHHQVPKLPLEDVYSVLELELGKSPNEIFTSFDEEPLGTASLAQVHKATLHNGQEVAVKVQHKFVKEHSFVDMYTMDFLVNSVKYFFPQFQFMWLAEEMKKNVPLELSFKQEAHNAEKVANMFKDFSWLKIPKIEWKYTTERVLVMEYCPGAHINDSDRLKSEGFDLLDISGKMGKLYSRMIFDHGYVHCDPHPGNVLVQKDAAGHTQIVLLDHGLYSQLSSQFRYNYAEFWQAIINRDQEGIKTASVELGVGELYGLFACMVTARSWDKIEKGLEVSTKDKNESSQIKQNALRYLKEISDVLAFVNRQMILILKTNDLLRSIEASLGTTNSMASFIQMSRSCMTTIQEKNLNNADTKLARFAIRVRTQWNLLCVSLYQFYLHIYWSRIGTMLNLRS